MPGNPIRTRREAEIEATNWTQLAEEWMRAKVQYVDKFGVTALPFRQKLHQLPPTPETRVIEGTSDEQFKRVFKNNTLYYNIIIILESKFKFRS